MKIKTINAWRGLMAVVVVTFHSGIGCLWNWTYSGVEFFFLASAFLLAMRHPFDRFTMQGYRAFLLQHASRLYPLNWLALALLVLLTCVFHAGIIDWTNVTLTALLVQSWSPVHDMHYGLNPVAWFMSVLIFCYLIYPLLARLIRRMRLRYKVLLAAILMALLAIILVPLSLEGREAVFVNPLAHVVDFTFGMMLLHLYHVVKDRYPRVGFVAASAIEVALLMLLILAIVASVKTTWFKPWEDVLLWMLPQGGILLAMAWLDGQEGLLGRLLLCRPLQWLGDISFEVFMLQFVAFLLFNYVISPIAGHYGLLIYDYKGWCVWLVLLPLAWAVNRFFTRPVTAFLNNRVQ